MDYISLSFSSSYSFIIAVSFTVLGFAIAVFSVRLSPRNPKSSKFRGIGSCVVEKNRNCDRNSSCNGMLLAGEKAASLANGGAAEMYEKGTSVALEKQTGASMMEQLVPEITTHALSYLDYPSLCRLSMTNSLMRKAANDDNAWKALYHKDFTMEQSTVKPPTGWKAYYAATRAIVNVNAQFFNIVRERSLQAMSRFWLNSDYVKCIHASGELFTGYADVMQSWQIAFNWEQPQNHGIQILDVRTRVLSDMAWVTMKAFVDPDGGPYNMTNIFEHHSGRWYMVHHHSSVLLVDGDVDPQIIMHA